MKFNLMICCCLFFCLAMQLQAQTSLGRQVVAGAGETTEIPQLSLSWTAGEAIVGPAEGTGISLHQGFQQAPSSEALAIGGALLRGRLTVRIYPNPTASVLHIERLGDQGGSWEFGIETVSGQKCLAPCLKLAAGNEMLSVDLSELPAGHYFLRVRGDKPGEMATMPFQKMP